MVKSPERDAAIGALLKEMQTPRSKCGGKAFYCDNTHRFEVWHPMKLALEKLYLDDKTKQAFAEGRGAGTTYKHWVWGVGPDGKPQFSVHRSKS